MIKLRELKGAMTYGSLIAETIQVGGYRIDFWHDQGTANPYEFDEGMTPALWVSLEGYSADLKEYGNENLCGFFDKMPLLWISRNWRKIAAILDVAENEHDKEARGFLRDYGGSLGDIRKDLFRDYLNDKNGNSWSYALDYMESLRALYALAGIPAETFQRNGYSQGDSVYGLIVMTPDWVESVGAPHAKQSQIDKAKCEKDMAAQADSYGAWAFGDCYGYTVSKGDFEDSCGGFIGDSLEDSGLWEYLQNAIVCHEKAVLRDKLAKVKAWVKAKTPLDIRAAQLPVA